MPYAETRVKPKTRDIAHPDGFSSLLEICGRLNFEPHNIAHQLDARGRYEVELDREFPFLIKLFHYSSRQHTRGATWHERLELFMPLDGNARFQMGEKQVHLEKGDILVVDNMKLHQVVDFRDFDTRVIVISFMAEFVHSLGSPSQDYGFLLPFYSRSDNRPHMLHLSDPDAPAVYQAIARLLSISFEEKDRQFYQIGCKAFFLEMLYHMARHFRGSELLKWEFVRQQQRSLRLKPIFDHISRSYSDKLTVAEAAGIARMSPPQFMKTFKRVAGMTLIPYIHHVRLSNAVNLLTDTELSIAEIAARVGFTDQSYFDKRFKASFGRSPKQFRSSE